MAKGRMPAGRHTLPDVEFSAMRAALLYAVTFCAAVFVALMSACVQLAVTLLAAMADAVASPRITPGVRVGRSESVKDFGAA